MEALKSSLMGLFEKKRFINFYNFVEAVDMEDEKTWKGMDLNTILMKDVYKKYKLESNTLDFLGPAVALQTHDGYLEETARPTIEKM